MSDSLMQSTGMARALPAVTDVYTNVQGLAQLKTEENKDEALKKVSQQFESMFINMMMKTMRSANAVFEEDSMFNSTETNFYRDMYDNQLSLTMAHGRGIGIADAMYRQMSDRYKNQMPVADSSAASETLLKSENHSPVSAQKSHTVANKIVFDSPESFVESITPIVRKAAKALGIEPQVMVAQAALETGWGKKITSGEHGSSFNLFNIKADSRWQGEQVSVNTNEFKFGKFIQERSDFRKYSSFEDSVNDFVSFLKSNPRYKSALESNEQGPGFVKHLQEAGYATDPEYANKVASVYNRITGLTSE